MFCLYNNGLVGFQEAKDPLVKAVLDGRQLALKVRQPTVLHLPTAVFSSYVFFLLANYFL